MENFEELLNQYIDIEEIESKLSEDEKEEILENVEAKNADLKNLYEYSITIEEFVTHYLQENPMEALDNLTHKQFKDLTKDNPLVVGIFNGDVDIDEVLKQDYIVVRDCFNNLGSYLNPEKLRDFTRLDIIEKQYEKVKEMRSLWCKHVLEHYIKYTQAYQEYMYLSHKCEQYEESISKAKKNRKLKELKQFVDEHGTSSIGIEEEDYDQHKRK